MIYAAAGIGSTIALQLWEAWEMSYGSASLAGLIMNGRVFFLVKDSFCFLYINL